MNLYKLTADRRVWLAAVIALGTMALRARTTLDSGTSNLAPMTALALFAVTLFGLRSFSLLFVVGTQLAGDFLLALLHRDWEYGFHQQSVAIYGSLVAIGLLGTQLAKLKGNLPVWTAPFALASSFLFFFITNLDCWATMDIYAKTWGGLMDCFEAAWPFYRNSFISDMLFSAGFCVLAMVLQSEGKAETASS